MSIWTVKPEDIKVDLTFRGTSFWIKLKKFLTVGEDRQVATAGWRSMSRDAEIQIDWQRQMFARAETYITDWSLTDDNAVKLPITREVIQTLDPDLYAAIDAAVNTHVLAMAEEKKLRNGSTEPLPTSA